MTTSESIINLIHDRIHYVLPLNITKNMFNKTLFLDIGSVKKYFFFAIHPDVTCIIIGHWKVTLNFLSLLKQFSFEKFRIMDKSMNEYVDYVFFCQNFKKYRAFFYYESLSKPFIYAQAWRRRFTDRRSLASCGRSSEASLWSCFSPLRRSLYMWKVRTNLQ